VLTQQQRERIFLEGLELLKAQEHVEGARAVPVARRPLTAPTDLSVLPALHLDEVSRSVQRVPLGVATVGHQWSVYTNPQPTNGVAYIHGVSSLAGVPAHLQAYLPLFGSVRRQAAWARLDLVSSPLPPSFSLLANMHTTHTHTHTQALTWMGSTTRHAERYAQDVARYTGGINVAPSVFADIDGASRAMRPARRSATTLAPPAGRCAVQTLTAQAGRWGSRRTPCRRTTACWWSCSTTHWPTPAPPTWHACRT
jgi:Zn-dependent M16 (insulinase) family peptidase